MARFTYPAIFKKCSSGGYFVDFPDIQGCFTQGETKQEARVMAKDVLSLALCDLESDGLIIKKPTPIDKMKASMKNENVEIVQISCDTELYRKHIVNEKEETSSVVIIPPNKSGARRKIKGRVVSKSSETTSEEALF
jgi:predicted RNase H-like HicB family nuclease